MLLEHRNLKCAIELPNIVTDSRCRLYETFSGNAERSLLNFLRVVRQAVFPELIKLIVVCEWLQETALTPLLPEANTGYWKLTSHAVMQGLRAGHAQHDGLVTGIDPDAVRCVHNMYCPRRRR